MSSNELDDAINQTLQVASRAPSAHNTQPWLVERTGPTSLRVLRDADRTLQVGDPTTRQATISIGMFAESFALASPAFGLAARVENLASLPRTPLLAELTVARSEPREIAATLKGLESRFTYRGQYQLGPAPTIVGSGDALVTVDTISEPTTRGQVGELAGEALRLAMSLPAMRRELADLVHWEANPLQSGMSIEGMVPGVAPTGVDPQTWWLEDFDPVAEAKLHSERFSAAPMIVAFSSRTDNPRAWFEVGRHAIRTLAPCAAAGFAHDIAAGPVEIPFLVPRLRRILGSDSRPQLLCRIGLPSGDPVERSQSSRRPVRVE